MKKILSIFALIFSLATPAYAQYSPEPNEPSPSVEVNYDVLQQLKRHIEAEEARKRNFDVLQKRLAEQHRKELKNWEKQQAKEQKIFEKEQKKLAKEQEKLLIKERKIQAQKPKYKEKTIHAKKSDIPKSMQGQHPAREESKHIEQNIGVPPRTHQETVLPEPVIEEQVRAPESLSEIVAQAERKIEQAEIERRNKKETKAYQDEVAIEERPTAKPPVKEAKKKQKKEKKHEDLSVSLSQPAQKQKPPATHVAKPVINFNSIVVTPIRKEPIKQPFKEEVFIPVPPVVNMPTPVAPVVPVTPITPDKPVQELATVQPVIQQPEQPNQPIPITPTTPTKDEPKVNFVDAIKKSAASKKKSVIESLEFSQGATDIPGAELSKISSLIEDLKNNTGKRISVVSYASSADNQSSTARRISLKRALALRKHFIDKGIENTRISVQALGNSANDDSSRDRIDILTN